MNNTCFYSITNRAALRALLLFAMLLTGSATVLAGTTSHDMNHGAMPAMTHGRDMAMQMSDAVVKKINIKRGKVTLQHGDIPEVMPAMTMGYKLKYAKQLDGIHVGDKVRFSLEKVGDDFVVNHLEIVR